TSPDNGQFAGPIRVERGVIKETKGLDINHDRSWEKNGGFQVVVSGPAKEILSQVSRAFYNKPGWFGLPPLARKFWRRHVEPTPGTVSLKLPQNHEPTHEELAALSGIAGDKQYAGRLVSAPTVAVSRAVLEKRVGDSGSPENLKKEVLLEMPLDFYEAHLKAIPVAEAIDKKYLTGNKSFVRVKVAADSIMKALHGEGGLGSLDADAFIDAVKDRTLRIGLENPLKPPQILFKLTPVEDVAVQVDPGSTKSLHDLEFKTDDPEYRPQFLKILARTARQGTAGGRGRAIGSFTFVGATFFSLPTNILMNAFFGYVDPEMWVKDATKSYFTRGLNMTFAPPILSRLKGGVLDYTAFHLYMPGMIFMGLLYSPIMSLTTGEPDAMLAKNAMVDLSMEKRIKERQQSQEKLLERERVVSNKKRNGLIENRLAHFLSTG
ncbi:MAG: hypothetical protein U1D33_02160, partial [bacterium]|nr:hypothetical protein [bacterium]